jgi:hypothetical protein
VTDEDAIVEHATGLHKALTRGQITMMGLGGATCRGASMSKYHVSTTINGEPTEFLCQPELTLLDVLRMGSI